MGKWKCGICNSEFDNYQAQGFNGIIYCPLCYFKELYKREKQEKEDYKSRCEKADNQLHIIMEIMKEQPIRIVEDDEWLENRLIGVRNILQNGDDSK